MAASTGRTLADILRAQVDDELRALGGSAEVRFDGSGREFLELTTPPWEFQVAGGGEKLGLREFRVTIRRDGKLQRTAHVFAEVRLVRPAVVARRPLSLGNFVRAEDVRLETRVFERAAGLGPATVEQVVGQQVRQFVAAGDAIGPDALKPVDLVQRQRPVTVEGSGGSVQVRLTGVALDSGGYGDTVRVRLGEGRNARPPVTCTVTGLGTVRMAEERP